MDDKLPDKLTEQLVAGFLVQAVREGLIDPRGKSEDELEREFLAYLKDVSDEEGEFLVVTDFTGGLLREARRFARNGASEIACLLYATWVEHWLNQMIQTGLARNGLSPAERNQALRQLPFPAKVSWVLPACGLRRIAAHHQKALIEIGDLRNWFIHYKWQGEGEDLPQRTAVNRAVENIDKSITYLRRFERRELFGEEKDHVQRYMARNRAKRK